MRGGGHECVEMVTEVHTCVVMRCDVRVCDCKPNVACCLAAFPSPRLLPFLTSRPLYLLGIKDVLLEIKVDASALFIGTGGHRRLLLEETGPVASAPA